jgi:EGF-like domain
MKNFNLKILMFCCVASVYFIGCGECGRGDCCQTKLNCGVNGTCLEGGCFCSDGYEGAVCDTLSNIKFIGCWKGQENHQHNGVTDTINIDWTAQASTKPGELKVMAANGTASILKLNLNKLTVQNEIILDNKHTIKSGTATINAAKTQINYEFWYKAVDTIPAFSGRGILVKQ